MRRLSPYGKGLRLGNIVPTYALGAFRAYVPAVDLFPLNTWANIGARQARRLDAKLLQGCEADGLLSLREVIAEYLNASRGVRCSSGQVIIVSGVIEALDVCTRLFLAPGDRVCVEDPGYPDAALLLESAGASVAYVPVNEEGLRVNKALLRGARMIYITPAHQAPLGVTMSLGRRLKLLDFAHRSGCLIFEDDYDSEYRYSGRPVPALQGLDQRGNVIFAGSFSKVLFPGLRLGYVVLPSDLVPAFRAVRSQSVRHAQLLDQLILRDFIDQGHFARHLRVMRHVYAERLDTLISEAKQRLSGVITVSSIEAGLQTIGWLSSEIDSLIAARTASERGLIVTSLHCYVRDVPVPNGIMLGFAAITPQEIRDGVQKLAAALESIT